MMFINLFKWLNVLVPFPIWVLTLLLIVVWWAITWGIARFLLSRRARPGRVIFSAQMVVFLVGALFIFNTTLVPIVLIAFNGIAFFTLCICGVTALMYFLQVTDKGSDPFGAPASPSSLSSSSSSSSSRGDDPFA
jgi:hypothetical protein